MRFMVIVKANKDTEAGVMPTTEQLAAMGKFNEEMVKAGVMLAGEGLHPSAKGARKLGEIGVDVELHFMAPPLACALARAGR